MALRYKLAQTMGLFSFLSRAKIFEMRQCLVNHYKIEQSESERWNSVPPQVSAYGLLALLFYKHKLHNTSKMVWGVEILRSQ